jgi:hypothetical protein
MGRDAENVFAIFDPGDLIAGLSVTNKTCGSRHPSFVLDLQGLLPFGSRAGTPSFAIVTVEGPRHVASEAPSAAFGEGVPADVVIEGHGGASP